MHDLSLNIEHITRVEGHGNLVINIKKGKIEELRLDIVESPRFFEAMILGRTFSDVAHITSRICGICAVSHTSCSLKALETALGVTLSEQTILLRKIIYNAEVIQSHVLHLYFLVVPDFFGVGSVFGLLPDKKEIVARGMRLKSLANDICALIGGRHVHPCSMVVGGFASLPDKKALKLCKERLEALMPDIDATVNFFKGLKIPDFERETEYLSLSHQNEYAFYDGSITSSDGGTIEPSRYLEKIKEYIVSHSTAKHAKSKRASYMVGALARFNNNHKQLHPKAKDAAQHLGLKAACYNSFMNNLAQVVETVHCFEDTIVLMDKILSTGLEQEKVEIKPKAGNGVGAVEAPRGTLYHEHSLDENGCVTYGNYIIPTAQNLANIEKDIEALVPEILDRSKDEITNTVEMLVRAYDPCISCATHLMKVRFV